MSIRYILSNEELKQLSQSDQTYLRQQLEANTMLNQLLNKPVNQHLLHELQCVLDSKPLPRQKAGQVSRLSDDNHYPCHTRKMTPEEMVKYGVKEIANGNTSMQS